MKQRILAFGQCYREWCIENNTDRITPRPTDLVLRDEVSDLVLSADGVKIDISSFQTLAKWFPEWIAEWRDERVADFSHRNVLGRSTFVDVVGRLPPDDVDPLQLAAVMFSQRQNPGNCSEPILHFPGVLMCPKNWLPAHGGIWDQMRNTKEAEWEDDDSNMGSVSEDEDDRVLYLAEDVFGCMEWGSAPY